MIMIINSPSRSHKSDKDIVHFSNVNPRLSILLQFLTFDSIRHSFLAKQTVARLNAAVSKKKSLMEEKK